MFGRWFLLLLLLSAAACTAQPTPTSTPVANQVELEEQAVYASLLPKMYQNSGYVIMDTTATSITGVDNTAQTLDYILQNMHDVDPETVTSFRNRND